MLKCKKGLVVKPLPSIAGYYLGTWDDQHGPRCRVSSNYCKTLDEAESLNRDRCFAEENLFCSGGDCGIHEVEG